MYKLKLSALFIFGLFFLIPMAMAKEYTPIEQYNVKIFSNKLLSTYNGIILGNQHNATYLNKQYFPLYSDIGESFRVEFMWPSNNNTECLYVLFFPIRMDYPEILIHKDTTYLNLFTGLIKPEYLCNTVISAENPIESRSTILSYNNDIVQVPYNIMIPLKDLLSNPYEYGFSVGKKLADGDLKNFERKRLSNRWNEYVMLNAFDIVNCSLSENATKIGYSIRHNITYSMENYEQEINILSNSLYICKTPFHIRIWNKMWFWLTNNALYRYSIEYKDVLDIYVWLYAILVSGYLIYHKWIKKIRQDKDKKIVKRKKKQHQ